MALGGWEGGLPEGWDCMDGVALLFRTTLDPGI